MPGCFRGQCSVVAVARLFQIHDELVQILPPQKCNPLCLLHWQFDLQVISNILDEPPASRGGSRGPASRQGSRGSRGQFHQTPPCGLRPCLRLSVQVHHPVHLWRNKTAAWQPRPARRSLGNRFFKPSGVVGHGSLGTRDLQPEFWMQVTIVTSMTFSCLALTLDGKKWILGSKR